MTIMQSSNYNDRRYVDVSKIGFFKNLCLSKLYMKIINHNEF